MRQCRLKYASYNQICPHHVELLYSEVRDNVNFFLCIFTLVFFLLFSKGNAPHSSTLAWKIPWTEEPGRLKSMRWLRVRHNWATSLSLFTFMHWRRKWQPTPVFLPGESQGRGAWWAAVYGVAQSWTRLKRLSSSSSSTLVPPKLSKFLKHFLFQGTV